MSGYIHFFYNWKLVQASEKDTQSLNNLRIVDILKSNKDSTISKPKHLRYFKKPPLTAYPLDLNENADEFIHRNVEVPVSMIGLIEHYLMHNKNLNEMPDTSTKICARRSTLIRIMELPIHKFRVSLILNVTKFKGAFYLKSVKKNDNLVETKLYQKFAQNCFAVSPDAEPVTNKPVDENEQWWGIYRAQLKNYDIIYSAELQGVDANEEIADLSDMEKLNECKFVLLQLCNKKIYFWKALRTFLQAKLAKISNKYVAERNDIGIVEEPIRCMNVDSNIRNPDELLRRCHGFLLNLLKVIEKEMHDVDCPYTVYQFVHVPEEKRFKLKFYNGKNEFSFLSDDFIHYTLQQQI